MTRPAVPADVLVTGVKIGQGAAALRIPPEEAQGEDGLLA